MRRSLFYRGTALLLSWIVPATTVWASAPPVVMSRATAPAWHYSGDGRDGDEKRDGDQDRDKKDRDSKKKRDSDKKPDGDKDRDDDRDRDEKDRDDDRDEDRDRDDRRDHDRDRHDLDCCDRDGRGEWDRRDGQGGDNRGKHHGSSCSCDTSLFGPKRYTRSSGPPNVYTDTVTVPGSVKPPYILRVENGESDGSKRVSSATIWVNGKEVAGPSDFNQHVSGFARNVSLTPQTILKVELASSPGSYLTISLCGQKGDTTAPVLRWTEPGPLTTTVTPRLAVRYEDLKGPSDPTASGIDTSTLVVTLDGADVTSLFTRRTGDASAEVPASRALSQGLHRLRAEIRDVAGNRGEASLEFRVDAVRPTIRVEEPPNGSSLSATSSPFIRVSYGDETTLDLGSLRITINGTDRTALFAKGPGAATATVDRNTILRTGGNQVEVLIRDVAGNEATDASSFTLDLKAPTLVISQPADGARVGSGQVDVTVQYSDDQGLDLATFAARLDGQPLPLAKQPDRATGQVQLAGGPHTLEAEIRDKAGNNAGAVSRFRVDTQAPSLVVVQPVPGSTIRTGTPTVVIHYSDDEGVDTQSLKVVINGTDRTSAFTIGADEARWEVPQALALPESGNVIEAQIQDLARNTTPTRADFTVDTIAPQVKVATPADSSRLDDAQPLVHADYSDSNPRGVDPGSVRVFIDTVDRTSEFRVGPASVEGRPAVALSEGPHALRVAASDFADNEAGASVTFTVDTQPPELTVELPKDGEYLRVTPAQVSGRVVDADPQTTVECKVGTETLPGTRSGSGPEAVFSCAPPLVEEANTIEVVARDRLAHSTTVTVQVTLDTKSPEVTIDTPHDKSWVASETITVTGQVKDASPIKTVTVNGVAATLTGSSFTASDVPVGTGRITAQAVDAAGNEGETSIDVRVDRKAPTVAITSPASDTWVLGPHVEVRGTVADAEGSPVLVEVNGQVEANPSPIVPRSFRVVVDAGEGPLDLVATARDAAGNAASTPPYPVKVDFTAPVITLSDPLGVPITRAASLHVAGSVTDISPVTLTIGGTSVVVAPDGSFSADVPLPGEGERAVALVATDAVSLVGTLELHVIVDRTPPELQIVSPTEGDFVLSLPVVVEGTVSDGPAGLPVPPVSVTVDGQPASVTGVAWTITFTSLPDGPHTFTAQARDAAGNDSLPAVRNVVLDLFPPTLSITDPGQPILTPLAAITVRGTVTGRAPLSVRVNGLPATVTGSTWEVVVPLAEGDNTITAIAKSASGRESPPASVMVTRDGVAPTIDLQTPESIGPSETARGRVDATDNMPGVVAEVWIDGVSVGPPSPTPYEFDIVASAQAVNPIRVTARATDKAGSQSPEVSRDVNIAAGRVVVGQVLSDETGLPLPDATVVLETPSGPKSALTDAHGGYSFATGGTMARLKATKAGMIPVERELAVASGVGSVVLDSRLTLLGTPVAVEPDGLTLPKVELRGPIPLELVLNVAPGAVSQTTQLRLTPLSAQGLPGLLPLGWSPLAAFDVRADSPVGPGLEATVEGLPDGTLHLARFDSGSRAWTMVQPELAPTASALTVGLEGTGTFALVTPDADPAPLVPAAGEALVGVAQADLPATAVGQAAVQPAILPPSGGKAAGRLFVQSPEPLPSGTVVQAKVTEEFELASGKTASEEVRRQDILLYRAPLPADAPEAAPGETVLHAVLPVTPTRTFEATDLLQGKVHLDVLAGRESVRGKTGGNKGLTLQSGSAILSVPGSSLAEDTVVDVQESALSSFLPTATNLEPLSEVVLDFTGAMLGTSAGLSVEGEAQAGQTLLVARVERVLGIPRLLVVALAEANGGRIAAVPAPGLPGIKEGGRYVFYRLSQPVGWVSGAATLASTGAPVGGAVVESNTLPFIGRSSLGAPYLLVVRAGAVQVSATVPGTRLVASGSVTTTAGGPSEATSLPLAFSGTATTATVTPVDGTLGVAVSVQVEIEATAALDPSATNLALAKLFKGTEPVEVRLLLSGSGKRLAVIPVEPLDVSTEYTFTAAGLKDAANEDVVVSPVSFTTKDFEAPAHDTDAIVFSYPEDGITKVTAPKGSLAAFSEVLILNATNGAVLWLQVDGDGCIGCLAGSNELPATIDDRLMVTITDPQGNVVTFERSKFVKEDGTVAIGPGGGVVEGAGGVELRIPSGALEKGVELKIQGLSADQFEELFPGQKPDVADGRGDSQAQLGSALRISSQDHPLFKKEVDLAFPVPDFTKAPEDTQPATAEEAFYFVYRRMEGPKDGDGKPTYLFETIDHAFVECPERKSDCVASEKKVVTASYPFSGYSNGFGAVDETGQLRSLATVYMVMLWTYPVKQPLPGVITGKVQRTKWKDNNPSGSDSGLPEFEPIAGAVVSGVDAAGTPLFASKSGSTMAISRSDGTFALYDPRYVGGTVEVSATVDGETVKATAFESNPLDWVSTELKSYGKNIATVNITYPAVAPPPAPPEIEIRVMTVVDGTRKDTAGLSVVNEPLIIGFRAKNGEVRGATVKGEEFGVRVDPLKGQDAALGMDVILTPDYVPSQPGAYTVVGTALPPVGSPITASTTFRVITAGGSAKDPLPDDAPAVITARTYPKAGAKGVPVTAFPFVEFTEPVKKIPGSAKLVELSGLIEVPVKLIGFGPSGPIDGISSPDAVITSLTFEPLTGLKFGTEYELTLSEDIQDLDDPPKALVPYTTTFTTFGPQAVIEPGEGVTFGSPGIVVLGSRAYLVENHFQNGTLRVFDVSDPVNAKEIETARNSVVGRPVDIAGEEGTVVVATGPTARSVPSNLYVFDATSSRVTSWVGAVSLTNSAGDGFINRIAVRADRAYAATAKKGIQFVDLATVRDKFPTLGSAGYFDMARSLNTDGQGWRLEDVVTIPVKDAGGKTAMLWDLEASDYVLDGLSQTLVVAVGDTGLVVANPQTQQVLFQGSVSTDDGASFYSGGAVTLGRVGDRSVAIVAGTGSVGRVVQRLLMVVALDDPRSPRGLGALALTDGAVEIVLDGDLALVGGSKQVTIVSLGELEHPRIAGVVNGVSQRVALTPDRLLLSTGYSRFGGDDPMGGIRIAALRRILALRIAAEPLPILFEPQTGRTKDPVSVSYRLIPGSEPAEEIAVKVIQRETVLEDLVTSFDGVQGQSSWAAGSPVVPTQPYFVQAWADPGTAEELASFKVPIPISDVVVQFDKERKAFVAFTSDGQAIIENTWDQKGTGLEPPVNGYDYKTSTRTFTKAVATLDLKPPRRPSDYMRLKILSAGTLIWEDSGGETLEVDVPEDGRIEAKLKAVKELAALTVQRVVITAEYFTDRDSRAPFRLKDDEVIIANQKLHGRVYDITMAALGRGDETVDAKATELFVGVIPLVGDGGAILGEIINSIDPTTDANKGNAALAVMGLAADALDPSLAIGAGISFMRIAFKEAAKAATQQLKTLPGRMWGQVKQGDFALVKEYAEGTCKLVRLGGKDLGERVFKEEADELAANRFFKAYGAGDDIILAQKIVNWDRIYADPDAVRSAIRALADLKDAAGAVIRLSDDAVEGAVKFVAKAGGDLPAAERERLLRRILESPAEESDAFLAYLKGSPGADDVPTTRKMLQAVEEFGTCPVVP